MSGKSAIALWTATFFVGFAFAFGYDAGSRHAPRPKTAIRCVIVYRDPTPVPVDPRCHGYRLNGVADVRCIPPIPFERNRP